ncbi:hypothetical protein [Leptolyngbya sp. KIOST-1]|uniref:hypothetical protein n=1 Tax=Leptolyngbya sp. KIOST-1 TaxID=1229172 RepID=UPI0018CD053B|nr:hypothetical protein [Leptolyngbya sp. KIOST-1]
MSASKPATLGDRLRGIAAELRQETDTQIKATSRILGAAAQMAQNHDRLVDEVVEMVEEDLERLEPGEAVAYAVASYGVAQLKQDFKTLKAAKAHFGIKAGSWDALATKLNQASGSSTSPGTGSPNTTQESVLERLSAIEQEMVSLRGSMEQVLGLLQELVKQS